MEEKQIIDLIAKGDTKVFSLLVDKYQNLIFSVVRRILPEQMDAEDVCQEVFVKIYKGIGSFKEQSKLSTWIAKIAYFTALNYLKKNKKKTIFVMTWSQPEPWKQVQMDQMNY